MGSDEFLVDACEERGFADSGEETGCPFNYDGYRCALRPERAFLLSDIEDAAVGGFPKWCPLPVTVKRKSEAE